MARKKGRTIPVCAPAPSRDNPFLVPDVGDGNGVTAINERLVKRQAVGPEAVEALVSSHMLLRVVRSLVEPDGASATQLRMFAAVIDAIESEQQRLWNFPQDPGRRLWFLAPGCSCPKSDNHELSGTGRRIVAAHCPVHGELPPQTVSSAEAGTIGSVIGDGLQSDPHGRL